MKICEIQPQELLRGQMAVIAKHCVRLNPINVARLFRRAWKAKILWNYLPIDMSMLII